MVAATPSTWPRCSETRRVRKGRNDTSESRHLRQRRASKGCLVGSEFTLVVSAARGVLAQGHVKIAERTRASR